MVCRFVPLVRNKRRIIGLVLLGALLSGMAAPSLLPADVAPVRRTYSARTTLPCDASTRQTAREIGHSLALLEAVRKASGSVSSLTATRLGLERAEHLAALTATALPVLSVEVLADSGTALTATADIFVPSAMLPDLVQNALFKEDILELKAETLSRMAPLAQEAETLLHKAVSGQTGAYGKEQLLRLGRQLEAANGYFDVLERSGNGLGPRAEVDALAALSRLDPENALILTSLAEAWLRQDRPLEALEAISKATRLEPELARAAYVSGLIQLRLRFTALAVSDFNRAIALRGDKAAWWRARAAALMLGHEYEPMCRDLYQACKLGDCTGLSEVRGQGLCLDEAPGNPPHEK